MKFIFKFDTIMLMEDGKIYSKTKEYLPHAHKLETPQPLVMALRDSAEKIGNSQDKELIANLVDFKQNIFNFMNHFNLEMQDFESDMEDKRFAKGGFTKRAVQKHPVLGVNDLRLVRDKLSDGVFLNDNEKDLYHKLLERKIVEETVELTQSMSRKERKEELGDVFEVFNTFLQEKRISPSLIEDKRRLREIEIGREKRRKLQKKK